MRRERGSIIKRHSGYSLVVEAGIDPNTGKRKQKWIAVKGGKREAEKKLTEILHSKDTGSFVPPTKLTLAPYLEKWLVDYAKPKLSTRSYERYSDILKRYIIPKLGRIPLWQLTPDQLQGLYSEWEDKGLSNATVRYHHAVIHNALRSAVKWGMIGRNVCDALEVPRKCRVEKQIWNEAEITQFLEFVKDNQYYQLFYLALFSGMRRSELLGLRWGDLDLLLGQIHVTRGLQQLKDSSLIFTQPKTEKSRRTIALPPSATIMLRDYRNGRALALALKGKALIDNDLVFMRDNGKPIRPNTITYAWKNLVKRSGLKPIHFHDCRHSHASIMLAKGVQPKIVQERLGHSSISITLDIYSHIQPGLQEAAAEKFDSLFKERVGNV
jgi:integrase